MQSQAPLFVVSLWRAGSSLLYALLNKHPDVALMYEADFPLLYPVFLKPTADWAERWEFLNGALGRHGLAADEFPGARDFRSAFVASHQAYAARKGAKIWGDKSPHYYDQLNFLAETFPGARFIIVWRDLFKTTDSIVRAASSGSSYFSKAGMPLRAIVGYERLKRESDALVAKGVPVCQVNYEELVRDPAAVMQGVCRFVGIPYSAALSTIEGADRTATHAGEHHRLLRGTKIVNESRPEGLSPALREKVGRYHAWYRHLYGNWPPYPQATSGRFPSLWRMLLDRVGYRFFRFVDALNELIFCVAPLWLLARYRQARGKVPPAVAVVPSNLR